MIRYYLEKDVSNIVRLGKLLHENYKFNLDTFSKCLIICDEKDKLIGFVIYSIIYERAEIVDIVVEPDHRRLGYGKKLMLEVISDIKKNKCENITLEVKRNNQNAMNFYYDLGFKIVRCIKHYYVDLKSNEFVDGYIMELKI